MIKLDSGNLDAASMVAPALAMAREAEASGYRALRIVQCRNVMLADQDLRERLPT